MYFVASAFLMLLTGLNLCYAADVPERFTKPLVVFKNPIHEADFYHNAYPRKGTLAGRCDVGGNLTE